MHGDKHVNEICVLKDCKLFNCDKRHPKMCKFKREYGRCKFTEYCRYDHSKPKDILENSDKLALLETKMKVFETEIEKKVETFETKFKTLFKIIEEKDIFINTLKKKLEYIDSKFAETTSDDMKNELNSQEAIIKKQQISIDKSNGEILMIQNSTAIVEETKLKCSKCDFTTMSKQGLKTHTKRKHTSADADEYPRTCDMCDEKVDSFKDMKVHLKTHSYKKTKFKCENCEFWGPNDITMEVHFGTNHSENIECGLCDFKDKGLENL